MTPQQIYTRVVTHLLKQNNRSVSVNYAGRLACAYRGSNGAACAVGCLIADEHYRDSLEGQGAASSMVEHALRMSGVEPSPMLRDLQRVHDSTHPDDWPQELAQIAHSYGLTPVEAP